MPRAPTSDDGGDRRRSRVLLLAVWLLVATTYVISAAGRIDQIDGQFKFDTAASMLEHHDFRLRDPFLLRALGQPARPYSSYAAGPSVAALPLVALGWWAGSRELAQFAFSLCSALLGALVPVLLLRAWLGLGLAPARALRWALASAFATLLWPVAASTFDQGQQGLVLLAAVLVAAAAGRRASAPYAAAAGAISSVLVHYQPVYAALLVPLALGLLDPPLRPRWSTVRLPAALVAGALPGLLALLAFNQHRFGSPFIIAPNAAQFGATQLGGAARAVGRAADNPLLGALVLSVSPGKGVVLYSPLIVVALLGVRALHARHARLARLAVGIAAVHFALVAVLPFPGGDWCWGPRYLTVSMPLLLLALPFGAPRLRRPLLAAVLAASLGVQLLGLSLDHNRFFFERGLRSNFWLHNHAFYFRHSQLAARVDELLDPAAPRRFPLWSSGNPRLLTYFPAGPRPDLASRSSLWMRQFAVFYWPRPWPRWMARLPEPLRPFNLDGAVALLAVCFTLGLGGLAWSLSPRPASPSRDGDA